MFEEGGLKIDWGGYILDGLIRYGIQIAILIIALLIIAPPIGKKLIKTALKKSRTKQSEARIQTLEKLLLNVFSYVLIFIFIVMFFGIIKQPIGPLLAGAGVIGLAVAFGAQGLVSDIVTGFFILLEKQVDVGDYVTAAGYDGIVEEVGLRTTQIRGFDGTLHFVPNREIAGVSNHSRGNMRALVDIGISYDDNIDEALTVLQSICEEFAQDSRFVDGPNVLGVQAFGSSEVVLRILGKTVNMEQWGGAERDIRKRIKEAFDQNNIEIPFPHQVNIQKNN
ncbi:potassium efflux system KefA protein [Gracilibacillus boraciitolerans JCM 21714]|uniref:Potassium efflux system KefA protein n=1 Tax=Gracilibacillus boraciitolerans JCM 21714 TaxID=1298598 RepID=W4VEI7_9BACI|nr:mechanosensitive ion channel family protein [Gracilibacillus boraciitolerans]GAE91815.1 potassium efflux system KefA protein [Gracilibacillus boraciitolerans JCM 21714]